MVDVYIWICDSGLLEIKLRFQDLSGPSPLVIGIVIVIVIASKEDTHLGCKHCKNIIFTFLCLDLLNMQTFTNIVMDLHIVFPF